MPFSIVHIILGVMSMNTRGIYCFIYIDKLLIKHTKKSETKKFEN